MRQAIATFNRGRISRHALARIDVERVTMSAEVQTNWLPRTLGSMSLRPGLEFLGSSSEEPTYIPFVYGTSDTAIIELTPGVLRIWDEGTTRLTLPSRTATVANPTFVTDLAGWDEDDDVGATSEWDDGRMKLTGTGYAAAIRRQEVVCQANVKIALRVSISRGPVQIRVGSTSGADNYVRETDLALGEHMLVFTPTGTSFHIELSSGLEYPVLVHSVHVASAGIFGVNTPWTTHELCRLVRWYQINDVVYVACRGVEPMRIERRANNSWSVVSHQPIDGPYRAENISPITLTPSAQKGQITLTASKRIFRSDSVGALYRITSIGQRVTATLTDDGQWSDPIRVVGVGDDRIFNYSITGTWTGEVTLQRSIGEEGAWTATEHSWTANDTDTINDDLDNVVIYYRIGFDGSGHSSGSANVRLTYPGGSITGTVRVSTVVSQSEVSAVVLKQLGGLAPSEVWAEGAWSGRRGFPTAVAISGGRLWWEGRGRSWGSISGAFTAHDPDFIGDAGAIDRPISDGPVDVVNWTMPLQRLVVGTDAGEHVIKASTIDEVITPSNYNPTLDTTQGSAPVPPAVADGRGYFVQRSRQKIYELAISIERNGYGARDLTQLCPEVGDAGFTRIAVQIQPDLRIHAVRADGTVAVLVRDPAEDVLGWIDYETDGFVTDVCVLPGSDGEDRVFYSIQRGSTWCHERFALQRECVGGLLSRLADCHVIRDGTSPVAALGGLGHLEGRTVIIWGDGEDLGEAVVSGGSIPLPKPAAKICAGLPYEARYKSAKIHVPMRDGTSLTQRGRARHLGLILADTHYQGLEFGPSFDVMDPLPLFEDEVPASGMRADYDEDMIEFPGDWETDSRVCLRAIAPRPATVLAAVVEIEKVGK